MGSNDTILVVEDDHDLLTALCSVLTTEGFIVRGVSDAEAAREHLLFASSPPSVMLLDLFLNGRLCEDLLESLADHAEAPPVVLCSASHGTGVRYSDRYAVSFIPKPFDLDQLLDTIELTQRMGRRPSRPMRVAASLVG